MNPVAEMANDLAGQMTLSVDQWCAWLPGIQGEVACRQWAAGALALDSDAKPDVSAVPAMMRRRLNGVGRLVAAVAWDLVAVESTLPMVFALSLIHI